jgi:hypothetical protein
MDTPLPSSLPRCEVLLAQISARPPRLSRCNITLLEIHVPEAWLLVGDNLNPEDIVSLLHAAARLEPEQFIFSIPNILTQGDIDVPCFRRASSIVLESLNTVALRMPRGINFIALDTLSLSGYIVGLDDLIPQCPRLRVLQLTGYHKSNLVNVHAPSLQELFVDRGYAHHIDPAAADGPSAPPE